MSEIDLDFKQLKVFNTLMHRRQVSAAAVDLNMSQPALSRSLARLRLYFDDPLFVRTQYAMEPTPCAQALAPVVDKLLVLYKEDLCKTRKFEPAHSSAEFKIVASDAGHVILFSRLIQALALVAPGIRLLAIPLGQQDMIHKLESGDADLAFGAFPKLLAGIHERRLYREKYVCLISEQNADIGEELSLEQYQHSRHVVVSAHGMGHMHEFIEKEIIDACGLPNVVAITHNFITSALIACRNNVIVTVPAGVADSIQSMTKIRIVAPPVNLPEFDIKLYWHERFHDDPAHRWLRQTISDIFEDTEQLL